jgi:DNA-binding GntR family transcriptional regulator
MSADGLRVFGEKYEDLRARTEEARERLCHEIREAAATMSEAEITRAAGVSRMTVRKALGK